MSFKRPSMRLKKKRNLDDTLLPELNIYDTRFNRRENLLLNILKNSCPKSQEFLNFPARLTEMVTASASNAKVCQEYDRLLKDTFNEIYSNFLVEGAKLKFNTGLMIDPNAKITLNYDTKNLYSKVAYPNVLSLITRIKYDDEIESFYENWDDLLYDIYVASEYAKYIFTYLDGITQQQLFELQSQTNINLYTGIISFFHSIRQTPGTDFLKFHLLDKEKFLKTFRDNKSKFPLVESEIAMSRKLLSFACNMTRDQHDAFLDTQIKAVIFEKFSTSIVEPKMFDDVREYFQTNSEQAKKIYGNADNAEADMIQTLRQMINTYKTPLVDKNEYLKVVEDVYLLYINKKLPLNADVDLSQTILAYESFKRGGELPKQIGQFVPLDETKIRKMGDVIEIKFDTAVPSKFNFLAPGNRDIPFQSNGVIFQSIIDFANFNMLVNILEVPVEKAMMLMSSPSIQKSIDSYIQTIQRKMIKQKVDEYAKEAQARRFFENHVNANFKLKASFCNSFLLNYFPEYLTDVKEIYVKDIIIISDESLVNYILTKADELVNAVTRVNNFRPNTINNQSGRNNLWNSIYKFKSRDVVNRIANLPEITFPIIKEAINYVKGNVLYNLTTISQEELGQLVTATYFELFEDAPQTVTLEDVNFTIDSIITILRTFVFNDKSATPRTNAELRLALSLILNIDMPNEVDETNFWNTIKQAGRLDLLSRILFMKKLHEVKPEEFFGPRSEVAFEAPSDFGEGGAAAAAQ
uniref:Uncharacterized protein n=1 Tax=viral metagenome TaxID=1070528 RepID=A0A6C0KSL8_9ZZZZ